MEAMDSGSLRQILDSLPAELHDPFVELIWAVAALAAAFATDDGGARSAAIARLNAASGAYASAYAESAAS